jgi:mannose-6-phosphate isomerase-like protein (cupin superfamily)
MAEEEMLVDSRDIIFPMVDSDKRRTILANTTLLSGKEISIIKLNKKKAIGGCAHSENEYWAVVSGEVIVSTGPENKVAFPGDAGIFPADVPHAFYALQESIIMEWGLEKSIKENSPKDKEMLNRVNELNL